MYWILLDANKQKHRFGKPSFQTHVFSSSLTIVVGIVLAFIAPHNCLLDSLIGQETSKKNNYITPHPRLTNIILLSFIVK